MTEFIILSRVDMLTLCDDKPVTVYVDKKPYVLCTDEYFEKQILILYRISEGSGSTRHNVKSLISKGVVEEEEG